MATPRKFIVSPKGDPTLHLISRCVRRAYLIGADKELGALHHRKVWIENHLVRLAGLFGVEPLTFAIMDNHFHLVVTMRRSWVESWSDETVVRKWMAVFPSSRKFRGENGEAAKEQNIQLLLKRPEKVAEFRKRLGDCGWLMKALKEPISRQANKEDGAKGAFWDARYKSVELEDEGAVLACMAYVDVNPLRAGVVETVEEQTNVGIELRIKEAQAKQEENMRKFEAWRDAQEKCRLEAAEDAEQSAPFKPVAWMRERSWLKPMDEHGAEGGERSFFRGRALTLTAYISLLEFTSQKKRDGKAHMKPELAGALKRLGLTEPEETMDRVLGRLEPGHHGAKLSSAA